MTLQWTIGARLWAFALTAALLIGVVGAAGLEAASRLGSALAEVRSSGQALRHHMNADMMHDALRADVLSALLEASKGNADAERAIAQDIESHAGEFRDALRTEQQLVTESATLRRIQSTLPLIEQYVTGAEKISGLAFRDAAAAQAALPQFMEQFEALEPAMESISESIEALAAQSQAHGDEAARAAVTTVVGVSLVALAILAFTAMRITRGIVLPIRRAVEVTSRIASGEIDQRIEVVGRDETSQLLAALAQMSNTISDVVRRVREAAESVTSSSREVAAGTLDLS